MVAKINGIFKGFEYTVVTYHVQQRVFIPRFNSLVGMNKLCAPPSIKANLVLTY